jgi:hypothetical protein
VAAQAILVTLQRLPATSAAGFPVDRLRDIDRMQREM